MNNSLKFKDNHDAIEFPGNLLKCYDQETIEIVEVFQLVCLNILRQYEWECFSRSLVFCDIRKLIAFKM